MFRQIESWSELMGMWRRSGLTFEEAREVLHIGPDILGNNGQAEEVVEAVPFYVSIIKLVDGFSSEQVHSGTFFSPELQLGRKSFQILVSRLPRLISSYLLYSHSFMRAQDVESMFRALIELFAVELLPLGREVTIYESEEPYRRHMENLVVSLWDSSMKSKHGDFDYARDTLYPFRCDIARVLMRAELFEKIEMDKIFEAIPYLKKDICKRTIGGISERNVEIIHNRLCPSVMPQQGEEDIRSTVGRWVIEQLSDLGSDVFGLVIKLAESSVSIAEIKTLSSLLMHQVGRRFNFI